MEIEINLTGILVATLIGMVLGALWYSPLLFGNAWMKSIGKTADELGSATIPMIGSILASFLTAVGVAVLFDLAGVSSPAGAAGLGAILALLIIFPAFLSDSLFCGWGVPLLLIQAGYRMLSVLLMSLAVFYF